MKILMTMVAALAITSAASAQQTECTFTTDGESVVRTFDGLARIVNLPGQDAVNVVNRRTGEILDTVEIEGTRFGVRCRIAGRSARPAAPAPAPIAPAPTPEVTAPAAPNVSTVSVDVSESAPGSEITTNTTDTGGRVTVSSPRRGFSPTATFGLPN